MIPLSRPYFDEDELNEVKKALDSRWVADGPTVKQFEADICAYLGCKYAIAVTNCTSALHLAIMATVKQRASEILVSDFTFPATGHAVMYAGHTPRFIDIDSADYNIDIWQIEDKIIPGVTKAILLVHTFGQPCPMVAIQKIAKQYGLIIIEDAACALGAKHNDQFVGTIGDVGCFSLHATKSICTGEGGVVVTNNEEIAKEVRHLSRFGMTSSWTRHNETIFNVPSFTDLGYNYKMSDITAAVGIAQLRKLDKIIAKRESLAEIYDDLLSKFDLIRTPFDTFAEHIYQSYNCLVDPGIDRNKLIDLMREKGIQTSIGTYASHIQPVYKSQDKCPVSLDVFNRSLRLPLYYELTEAQQLEVVKQLKECFKILC
ncbi:MAG: hypothetical protein A2163_00835 [Actinobacteria bacterium RBG_13_35_12]|nr:MAG: hypothetical protein A2163_00835 [Actinobacteria bacterium RBG_13_35_12]